MILIAVWMALWFAERLSKPVGRLAEAAKKVGSGDFDIKVMEENTKDEIAFLSKVFNRMTNRLKNQRNKLLENNKIVEHFGKYAGYGQQFLFKNERESFDKKWLG